MRTKEKKERRRRKKSCQGEESEGERNGRVEASVRGRK
jgi:hypothetical protein